MHGILRISVICIVLAGFVWLVTAGTAWLFTLGGAPSEKNGAVHYGLRPAMQVLLFVLAALGVWAIVIGVASLSQPRNLIWVMELFGGLAMVLAAAFGFSARISLDAMGLHYRRGWKRTTRITWEELDHYEVLSNGRTKTETFFFRSKNGKTIPVEEGGYDVTDMLRRIRMRRSFEEQPYKRRHWYGG